MGHKIGRSAVGDLLHQQQFSLQANRKTCEGDGHPDRDAQFKHLNEGVRAVLAEAEPVISADTKKKELVGDFKNAGRTWRPRGEPEEVRVGLVATGLGSNARLVSFEHTLAAMDAMRARPVHGN